MNAQFADYRPSSAASQTAVMCCAVQAEHAGLRAVRLFCNLCGREPSEGDSKLAKHEIMEGEFVMLSSNQRSHGAWVQSPTPVVYELPTSLTATLPPSDCTPAKSTQDKWS